MTEGMEFCHCKKDSYEPLFKAVNVNGRRRGIRLENEFWIALDNMCKEQSMTVGGLISNLETNNPDAPNLSSIIRVCAMSWLENKTQKLVDTASSKRLHSLINGCPAASVSLTKTDRFPIYNNAFLRLIRANMPNSDFHNIQSKLRLKIDMTIDELLERLKSEEVQSMTLGFVVALDNRNFRAKLNLSLAPVEGDNVIIGFVVS